METMLMEETTNQIEGYRLAPQQEHVWSLQEDSQTYRSQCAILLQGDLKVGRLKEALQDLVDNYEILRTTFHQEPTAPSVMQVIASDSTPEWREVDLESQSLQEQEQKIAGLFRQEGQSGFDFEQGPLLKVCLAKLGSDKQLLLINLPALCADTRTLKNIVHQVGRYYSARLAGQTISEELLQYADLSEWQHELIESRPTEVGALPWMREAHAALPQIKLPFERQIDSDSKFDPELLTRTLDADTVADIEELARQHDVPVSILLLACWQILLWRLTGAPIIVVGSAFDGRNYEELEEAIGLFVRHLPIYVCLKEGARLSEILQRVKQAVAEADDLQSYFSREEYEKTQGRANAMVAGFEFDEEKGTEVHGDLSISIYRQSTCVERYKINLNCLQAEKYLKLEFQYDQGLFGATDIERISDQYVRLIESAIEQPDGEIGRLEIMSRTELDRLLVEGNNTKKDYPSGKCVHELFEAQVKLTPAAVAAVYQEQEISYAELNRRANQLAHYLRSLGVGPDALVGICLERSLEMVVALLGILKAGGAYLPLDPSYPRERLSFIIEDAQLSVLLTEQSMVGLLPANAGRLVLVDSERDTVVPASTENPEISGEAANLAYVIYTSGSTGRPKGVMITHQGLVNYLSWCTTAYNLAEGKGAPVHSPLGFDLTVTSLFSPLLVGRTVTLLPEGPGIEMLGNAIRDGSDFSLIKLTPAHLDALEAYLPREEAVGKTRALIIGGEALSAETIAFWQQNAPLTRLVNEYGPTETVVGCCVYEVPAGAAIAGMVPIGTPIANTEIFLLSGSLTPVPVGVVGELYIGGPGLARGYLSRPDLTAEKFVPNPFSTEVGARLYRSGDLARFRQDGNIEYLGRIDGQVKIRGFRIELGEIETTLEQHKALRECVVVAREDVPGEKRLVAYVVTRAGALTSISDLQDYLSERLPNYMVPTSYVLLDTLPLTANGKIDSLALPPPGQARSELRESFVPPRDTLELQLMELWQDILNVPRIGVTESFFDVGGNSLLAVRLMAQVDRLFDQNLPLSVLFENRTIEKLAGLLRQQKGSMLWSSLVEIQPHGSKPPLFFVHPSGGGVLGYIHLSRRLGEEQPFYGFQSPGLYGEASHTTIEGMAAEYIAAMRLAQPEGPYLLGGWSLGGVIAFEMAQQLQKHGDKVALLALLDTRVPIQKRVREEREQAEILADLAKALTGFLGRKMGMVYEELQKLEPEKQLEHLLDQMIKAHVVSPGTGHMHMKRFVEVYTTNSKAILNYTPQPYTQPITLFRAEITDPEFLLDDPVVWGDPALGWKQLASGGLDIRMLPTTHDLMIFEPNVEALADSLAACLDEINQTEPGAVLA
jgi:amino acid adenylation domain-containing protein